MPATEANRPAVVLIDHGTGNLTSLERALALAGAEVKRGSSAADLDAADGVVLPGVGAFPSAMKSLERLGLTDALREFAVGDRPLLGVCLGMQMLFEGSEEAGGHRGLGILAGPVRRLESGSERLPHIGWTAVDWEFEHPLNAGLPRPTPQYHVHSFVCDPDDRSIVLATANHGETFVTAVASGGTAGVQFHPEKSSTDGLRLVANFVESTAARIVG